MNLDELAKLMGKTVDEVKEILDQNDVIELKLTEIENKKPTENGNIEILE